MNRLKRKAKMDARAGKKAEESFNDQLLTDLYCSVPDRSGDTVPSLDCWNLSRGMLRAEAS